MKHKTSNLWRFYCTFAFLQHVDIDDYGGIIGAISHQLLRLHYSRNREFSTSNVMPTIDYGCQPI
jgi:hypothetical protein